MHVPLLCLSHWRAIFGCIPASTELTPDTADLWAFKSYFSSPACNWVRVCLLVCAAWACYLVPLAAQTLPDAGSLRQQGTQDTLPIPGSNANVIRSSNANPGSGISNSKLTFIVGQFSILGATLLPQEMLQTAVKPWVDRPVSFSDLQDAASAIVEVYRSNGWIVRTIILAKDIGDGVVEIQVIEARLASVRVDNRSKKPSLASQYLVDIATERQKTGDPVRLDYLERASSLLSSTPGFTIKLLLAPSEAQNSLDLIIIVQDAASVVTYVTAGNEGARYTGSNELSAVFQVNSPLAVGDQFALEGDWSEGAESARITYSFVPASNGAIVGLSGSSMHYTLLHDFAALNAKGDATTLGLFIKYPLVRSHQRNVNMSLNLEKRQYNNEANTQVISRKLTDTATFGIYGISNVLQKSGFFLSWGVNLNFGNLDLSADPTNEAADIAGPNTKGSYSKLTWNASMLQPLWGSSHLWFSASGQLTQRNLDSSEKFYLGGADGVRAYPKQEGQGDSGWLATAELRTRLDERTQLLAFYDIGGVKVHTDSSFVGAEKINNYALSGIGMGVIRNYGEKWRAKATAAKRLGSNPLADATTGNDSDGSNNEVRLWLSATRFF